MSANAPRLQLPLLDYVSKIGAALAGIKPQEFGGGSFAVTSVVVTWYDGASVEKHGELRPDDFGGYDFVVDYVADYKATS